MDKYPTMDLYAIRMTKVMACLFAVIMVGGTVYFRSVGAFIFALGALVAVASNVVKVFWLKRSVSRAMQMDNPAYGAAYIRGQGMLRMFFTLAVLVGAGFLSMNEAFGLPVLTGAILGFLTMPVAAYSMGFFARKDYKNTEQGNPEQGNQSPEGDNTHAI